uniref:Uncharacterized protein n=1 Tax=Anopheles dirus TaxID=7168 RepID=A0A182NDZ0_9DIPT
METDLAYEVLADYSLQETPFYEAPTPTATVGVNFYPPPNEIQSQHSTDQQHHRSSSHGSRRNGDTAYDLSLATSMLTGKMQLMNTGGSAGSGTNLGGGMVLPGSLQHHTASLQANQQNQHQTGIALVPIGIPSLSSGSSLASLSGNGGGLAKPKKMKKSVSFLPTFVQGCDGDSGPIQLKQEPLDDGPIRNIQKVPSLSDLSDPEASLVLEEQEQLAQITYVLPAIVVNSVGGLNLRLEAGVCLAHRRNHATQLQQQLSVKLTNHFTVEMVQLGNLILRFKCKRAEVSPELNQHIELLLGTGQLYQRGH